MRVIVIFAIWETIDTTIYLFMEHKCTQRRMSKIPHRGIKIKEHIEKIRSIASTLRIYPSRKPLKLSQECFKIWDFPREVFINSCPLIAFNVFHSTSWLTWMEINIHKWIQALPTNRAHHNITTRYPFVSKLTAIDPAKDLFKEFFL